MAMIVTPLIARVFFLLIIGRSFFASAGFRALIKSALAGTASKWYFAATFIFNRLTSSCVGDCAESKVVIISLRATWLVKGKYQNKVKIADK
jgi:hypothetical protein